MASPLKAPEGAPVSLQRLVRALAEDPAVRSALGAVRLVPAERGRSVPLPDGLAPEVRKALEARGIRRLYTHQAEAVQAALEGRDVLQITPTASGKSLGFILPILHTLTENPDSRSLLLFPTKALAQDQLAATRQLAAAAGLGALIETYDGDTPPGLRRSAELGGRVILTNPDMLHAALLPHHTKWRALFTNLTYVIVDELHTYRGVFGSHVANVLRRLFRLSEHYGSHPVLLMASATVGNPEELAQRLTGRDPVIVTRSGAARGPRLVGLLNPPSLIAGSAVRPSPLDLAVHATSVALSRDVPTILFVRSRLDVEIAYRRLLETVPSTRVAPYRGGYLPNERRRIEAGLRSGEIRGVVSTNALELGVDIGQLDTAVLAGFPPTMASTWQEIGRSGRGLAPSVALVVAGPGPRDQYLFRHPEQFFEARTEGALLNPDNLHILVDHVKASAFELPFDPLDSFGGGEDLETLLAFLADGGVLRHAGGRYFYASPSFPAHDISLRTGGQENVVIVDTTAGGKPIGEVDRPSAPTLVHDQAIYLHMGRTYEVTRLDLKENKAYVRPTEASYLTDANLAVDLGVLREDDRKAIGPCDVGLGDIRVTWLATIFKKIHLRTGENLGWGRIQLPEDTMHTRGAWFILTPEALATFPPSRRAEALSGLGYALHGMVPILTMTAPGDSGVHIEVRSPFTLKATVTIYDRTPGGVGIAEQVSRQAADLWKMASDLVTSCACEDGCPSCVGEEGRRSDVMALLQASP